MFSVRDIREADREQYVSMSFDFYSGDAVLYPPSRENFDATFDIALHGSPLVRLVMIEEDDEVAGYGNLSFTWSTEAGGVVCWIEEIYVLPEKRGHGLGQQYLDWVRESYDGFARRYRLEVCPQNPDAKRLYERHGFRDLGYLPMVCDIEADDLF